MVQYLEKYSRTVQQALSEQARRVTDWRRWEMGELKDHRQ